MNYEEWLENVPPELSEDALWRMKVYRLALFAGDLAWHDVTKLVRDGRTLRLSSQLYSAVGSIAANIAEGYSHQSRKDQARFYEYSLGSAREARVWYYQGRSILSDKVVNHRLELITQIIRLLLTIIPSERGHKVSEEAQIYGNIDEGNILNYVPLP
jgi:four helix bundle protein